MKMKQKLLTTVIGLSTILAIASPIKSNAALQANGSSTKTDTIENWLLNIRKMETVGGTLGLKDTIDTTTLVSSADVSNDIDIHMQKNTEYGAMAILSASAYGNQNKIESGETTTGNKSGVYMYLNKEWVSAGTLKAITLYTNSNSKYKNLYSAKYSAKVGDAISETEGWHGSDAFTWIHSETYSGLIRAYSGSIFSYYGYGRQHYAADPAYYTQPYSTRAVIVIGNGF